MRIAIVKLSALGDIIHAMITLQYIKKYMPDSEIIDVLSGIYLAFDLQKQVNQEEEEKNTGLTASP